MLMKTKKNCKKRSNAWMDAMDACVMTVDLLTKLNRAKNPINLFIHVHVPCLEEPGQISQYS